MENEDKDAIGPVIFIGLYIVAILVGITVNYYYSFHKAEEIFADVIGKETFDTESPGFHKTLYFSYMLDAVPKNGAREVKFAYSYIDKGRTHPYYISNLKVFLIDKDGNEIESYPQWVGWTWGVAFDYVPAGPFQLISRGHWGSGL